MTHATGPVPRLVCAQGLYHTAAQTSPTFQPGDHPVYRHPSDHSPPLHGFSPAVAAIAAHAEALVGHPLNHALLQLYRGGADFISEHADKTLDLVRGSAVVNVSLGARRTMRLRAKKQCPAYTAAESQEQQDQQRQQQQRDTQLIPLPHGSIFVLGARTNARYLHSIPANKRPASELSAEELAFGGARVSLTFRHIGTWLDADERVIWGQGAVGKTRKEAGVVVTGGGGEGDDEVLLGEEGERLLRGFGRENQEVGARWEECYGRGSDVLHLRKPPS